MYEVHEAEVVPDRQALAVPAEEVVKDGNENVEEQDLERSSHSPQQCLPHKSQTSGPNSSL